MIKREYVIKNDKLFYVDNDPAFPSAKEVECTKEELTALILKQDKNKSELSDEYIQKVADAMKEAASITIDYRYEIAKSVLQGMIAKGVKNFVKKDYYHDSIFDDLMPLCFDIADKFMKEYSK